MTVSSQQRSQRNLWALGGVLFAVFFTAGDFLRGALASRPLPLPGAPVEEVVSYFTESSTSVLAQGTVQFLSALSLFVFVAPVATLVRRVAGGQSSLPAVASGGGVLSAVMLLASVLLSFVLVLVAQGGNLALVDILRQANFLTGGTFHIASLGLFIGATSIAARRAKALPGWIYWLGLVQATLAILSLASLFIYYANAFILFGRMLGFLWCISAGIVLVIGRQREPGTRA